MNKHTATLLEQHFDTAFASLEGVARLRELILTLAMQGKLVEQDPKDQPASELLKDIEAEKKRLVAEGKIRKQKPLPPVSAEEMPYELPEGWEWIKLGEISTLITDGAHHTPTYVDDGVPFLSVKDMSSGKLNFSDTRFISQEQHSELTRRCKPELGDILLTKVGTTGIPVLIETDRPFSIFVSVALIKFQQNCLNGKFLTWLFGSPLVKKQSEEGTEGVGNKNLVLRKISNFVVPLPPLSEQHRIVAKIDELMARCDALEVLHQQHEEKRLQVHTAAIHQLLESNLGGFVPSCESFDFLAKHFSELYSVPENVTELRKAILQLAVMGRLVPQNPDDPPASQLLEEIRTEKKWLVAEGKIKKQKPLPAIKPGEVPYVLPEGWEWVRLGDVVLSITGGGTPSKNNPTYWGGSIPWASVKDMNVDIYLDKTVDSITETAIRKSSTNLIPKGNIIVCTRMGLGKIAINSMALAINQDLKALKISEFVNQLYFFKNYKNYEITGSGMTVKGVRQDELLNFYFPLPPLPEQQRIVAKIDQLMSLCDQLDQHITARTEKQTELLNAVMGQV